MPRRILIIDDERDMRVYLSRLLQKAGYETELAEDGDEGLRRARTHGPDLITLDLIMPKMSGFEVYERLRSGKDTRNIPVIVVTGLSRQKANAVGEHLPAPDGILEKPIDQGAFVALVREKIGE